MSMAASRTTPIKTWRCAVVAGLQTRQSTVDVSVPSRVAIIINPVSGLGVRPDTARQRAEQAAAFVEAQGVAAEIFVTERRHHARELTQAAVARGAEVVIAWGGDGTVNEVASALVFRDTALGVVPSGSGNGLARELGLPFEPRAAFERALGTRRRRIDAGELGGHLFFNVAGIGLDADVAHRFAATGHARRGLSMYVVQSIAALLVSSGDTDDARGGRRHARRAAAARGLCQRSPVRQRRAHRAARARGRRPDRRRRGGRSLVARDRPADARRSSAAIWTTCRACRWRRRSRRR